MHLKHYKLPFLFTTIFPLFIMAQNEVCFEIESNPNPLDLALNSFSKYVNVLDCFHIYAESSISDAKVLHAAAVAALVDFQITSHALFTPLLFPKVTDVRQVDNDDKHDEEGWQR